MERSQSSRLAWPQKICFYLLISIICLPNALANSTTISKENTYTLCFISLNNAEEFTYTKSELDKRSQEESNLVPLELKDSSLKLNVVELQAVGEYPIVTIQKAIRDNHCHGLVLSGHHRKQGFDGNLVPGYLPTHELLSLSCQEDSQKWFKNVKHLWLQGCATGLSNKQSIPVFADTFRIIFPNATIYTWSGSAPSRVAPKTIPYHFLNLEILYNKQSPETKVSWSELLQRFFSEEDNSSKMQAWRNLRYSGKSKWHGIYNYGAKAKPPLTEKELTSRSAVCSLASSTQIETIFDAYNSLLSTQTSAIQFLPLLLEFARSRAGINATVNSSIFKKALNKRSVTTLKRIYDNETGNPLNRLRALNLALFASENVAISDAEAATLVENALIEISNLSSHWDSVEKKHYRWETYRELFFLTTDHNRRYFNPTDLDVVKGAETLSALIKVIIEVAPPNRASFIVKISEHEDFSPSLRRELTPMLALVSPLERKAIRRKIEQIQSVRTRSRIPASE